MSCPCWASSAASRRTTTCSRIPRIQLGCPCQFLPTPGRCEFCLQTGVSRLQLPAHNKQNSRRHGNCQGPSRTLQEFEMAHPFEIFPVAIMNESYHAWAAGTCSSAAPQLASYSTRVMRLSVCCNNTKETRQIETFSTCSGFKFQLNLRLS